MKCLVCGREMLNRGTHFECPNILCDYEEEIENKEVSVKPRQELPRINFNGSAITLH
jgi:hypothetical protein